MGISQEISTESKQRYRATIVPLILGRRVESQSFEGYTWAGSPNQAAYFLTFRYPPASYTVETPVLDMPGPSSPQTIELEKRELPGKEYPLVLTMAEYEQQWKPQGWNIIFIGPTSTWRQEWGTWEAIRDIVQNCLDEAESYQWGYDNEGLWIADQGRGVAVSDFLLGPPKLKPDYARGKFGEGMKIACLAMVRQGYPVKIETVGREIHIIFIEQEADGYVQSLAALWRPDGTTAGTKFHFIDYFGDSYAERFTINLPPGAILFQGNSKVNTPVPRFNQLIDTEKIYSTRVSSGASPIQSVIFARDIYMAPINSLYSYNLWDFEMSPDRFGPKDDRSMYLSMGRLWATCENPELIKIFLQMISDPPFITTAESHSVELGWLLGENPAIGLSYMKIIEANAWAWKEAWRQDFGDNVVLRTDDKWDAMVKHLGYSSQSVSWGCREALGSVIKKDTDLITESQERLRDVEIIPDTGLNPKASIHLHLARAIVDDLARHRRVRGVHAAIIPPASDRVRTAGMYGRKTEEIFISADMLETGRATVDTTIHELAHHTTGAEDGEEAHNAELSRLGGLIVERVSQGFYDKVIKEPSFTW